MANNWTIFNQHPIAQEIAEGLNSIPSHWALTPVREKRPYRKNWQHEPPISHDTIKEGILNGNEGISTRTGKPYTAYDSGFGLRLGDVSNGLIAIDVDGESAGPLLEAISGGNIPETISWTSGKTGRYQLLFQIPEKWRDRASHFTRAVITEYEKIQTKHNQEGKPEELLELRYNGVQSVLPPSYHPSTGAYYWLNSPQETEVAIAPPWLINWLISFAEQEARQQEEQERKQQEREQRREERKRQRQINGFIGADSLEDALEKAVDTLDYEDVFSWSGHKFKRNGRKLVGYCPQHESSSGTAFQINPNTKEWYCHGCQEGGHAVQYRHFVNGGNGTPTGQDFIAIARELCSEANVDYQKQLEAEHGKEIDPLIAKRDRAINAVEEALAGFQSSASKFVAWAKGKEVSGEMPTLYISTGKQTTANYKPNQLDKIQGEVIYRKGQRHQIWSEGSAKGYKVILDKSDTGQGKSYDASQLKPANFDFRGEEDEYGQLVYFVGEPDNPSVTLLDWQRVPTLHEGNCHKWEERRALGAKGVGRSSGKGKYDANPICNKCPFLDKCRHGSGDGYGFKFEMKSALADSRIYAHPLGFPRQENGSAIALYDEFQSLITATSSQTVTLKQVSRTFTRLQERKWLLEAQGELDSLYEDLIFLKDFLEPYLSGAKQTPQFGLDLAEIQKIKPDWSDAKTAQIVDLVDELEADWGRSDLQNLNQESTVEDVDRIVDQPFLGTVLAILTGYNSGALRVWGEKLIITQTNDSAIAQLRSFKTSILLDATLTKEDLIFAYGLKPEEILECRQEPTPTPNLKIKQLTNAGLNTSQRSEAGQERKETIIETLKAQYGGNLGVIDYKAHSSNENDLHHFRSGEQGARGSNRFKDKRAVASVGTPYIALNAVLDSYQAITGETIAGDAKEHDGFRKYYESLTQKEVIQEVGRLRANLRPDEDLDFYLINDLDPTFLSTLGIEVTRQPVWDVVRDLRPRALEKLEGIAEFFAGLVSRGYDLSKAKLKDAAQAVNSTSADLSRLLKQARGWISLREKINNLFKTTKGDVNFSDWEKIFKTKLGQLYQLELLESPELLVQAIEEHGWQAFYEYFEAAQLSLKGELLALMLNIILRDRANWLSNLKDFCLGDLGLSERDIGINSPPT